ncbi:MAG TPA: electron transfer flavoprotein subunit alpha/FixB family protein [Nitriliruptoraceae bacterium]|nr:electron transfer flavoprotein subunit alpha/FixB family protein [Nitriliruptoraceae bacterium]
MAQILVLIDHNEDGPRKVSLQMLTAARRVAAETGDTVAAAWLGEDADDAEEELGANGAQVLYWWDSEDADGYVTLPKVEALATIIDEHDVSALLFASSNHTKDVAARLAIRIDGGVITDATDLAVEDGTIVATKEVFGGATITKSRVADGKFPIFGISANAFPREQVDGDLPELVDIDFDLSEAATKAVVTSVEKEASADRPDIGEAAIVIAGGRGLGNEDGFELMEELADVLGAGVGASRAATDAGWYPHRYQIGQTGRTISPMLYMGSGISGAIQHRAGMQTSQNIVAINKDAEAPIFQIADFGVVGDLYDVVPALVEELRDRKG